MHDTLTLIHGRPPGRDIFHDHPLLRGRFWFPDDVSGLDADVLEGLWMDLYRFRYLAALIAGDEPLARSRFDELDSLRDRIETAARRRPLSDVVESQWVYREDPAYGAAREVEVALDDPEIPDEIRIEHIPVYSSGGKFLVIRGASAMLWEGSGFLGRLITAGDWRRARSERIHRTVGYTYYGSGWSARTDIGKFVMPIALKETIEAYRSAARRG